MDTNDQTGNWADAIARARTHAPFLRALLDTFGTVSKALIEGKIEGALAAARAQGDAADTALALRRERSAIALALAIGDLASALPLEAVTAELSDLVDRSIARAADTAMMERTPGD